MAEAEKMTINTPLIQLFIDKLVLVEIEGCTAIGKLVGYSIARKNNHKPNMIILENGGNRMLLRGNWITIKSLEVKNQ